MSSDPQSPPEKVPDTFSAPPSENATAVEKVPGTISDPQAPPTTPATAPLRALDKAQPESWTPLERSIVGILETVFDPEIPVNIWELGLIYSIRTGDDGHVELDMTLTSPMCPVAGSLPPEVQQKVAGVAGVMAADVNVTWEPPWEPSMMSEAAKLTLNVPY
jgi:FeS assembly SUF system protein